MKTLNRLLFLFAALTAIGCEDIVEEDISGKTASVTFPINNEQVESNVVNFQWDEIDGADKYRVQIYAGNQNMVLDSLVEATHLAHALSPGDYKWRVRGENFAYETAYSFPEEFTVIETSNLENQQVLLSSPSSGYYTQNTSLTFSWNSLSAAEYYTFQLVNVTDGNTILYQVSELTDTFLTLNNIITDDAQYLWKVKAVNSEGSTQFASRTFYIDRTAPNQSLNIAPLNNSVWDVDQEVNFEWSSPNDTGTITSPVTYTVQIASEQNFQNIIQTDNTSIPSYSYTFAAPGNYYWRVRAIDQAGNQGSYSSFYKIEVE